MSALKDLEKKMQSMPVVLERPHYNGEQGVLVVNAIIAREGVYPYELEGFKGYAYLPGEEINNKNFLDQCNGIFLIKGHTEITSDNFKEEALGTVYDCNYSKGLVTAKIRITDGDTISEVVNSNTPVPVSLQYDAKIVLKKGNYRGMDYTGVQTGLNSNHLAIVRAPNMVVTAIKNEYKGGNMADTKDNKDEENKKNNVDNKEGGESNDSMMGKLKNFIKEEVKNSIDGVSKMIKEEIKNMAGGVEAKMDNIETKFASSDEQKKQHAIANSSFQEVQKYKKFAENVLGVKLSDELDTVDKVVEYATRHTFSNQDNVTDMAMDNKKVYLQAFSDFKDQNRRVNNDTPQIFNSVLTGGDSMKNTYSGGRSSIGNNVVVLSSKRNLDEYIQHA